MNWLLWALLSLALLGVFLYWNSRPINRSREEVIETINAWLNETVEHGVWDYFESCKIKDKDLEAVRLRCVELSIDPEFTVEPKMGSALNDRGKEEVRHILLELKSGKDGNAV